MTDMTDESGPDLVCVDPQWGRQLWRLEEINQDPQLIQELQDHLFICAACRQSQFVARELAAAIRSGEVKVGPVRTPLRTRSTWRGSTTLGWGGAALVAAALALVFILPPRGLVGDSLRRGEGPAAGFARPVEGEVLRDKTPVLKWQPIAGATSYVVEISEVAGDYVWSTGTDLTSVQVPPSHALPRGGHFRGLVRPVPPDLAGPVEVSVTFRLGGYPDYLGYRFGAAPLWLRAALWLGVAVALLALVGLRRRQRLLND